MIIFGNGDFPSVGDYNRLEAELPKYLFHVRKKLLSFSTAP